MRQLLLLLLIPLASFGQLAGVGNLTKCNPGLLPNSNGLIPDCHPTAQTFFGTAAPGNVGGNMPGDVYSDTTNHNVYLCGAAAGASAPACTTVATSGWMLIGGTGGSVITPTGTGLTHLSTRADSSWDTYLTSTDPVVQAELVPIERLTEYLGFGNQFTGRFKSWAYTDIYAIYNPSDVATAHPDWILKDSFGNNLFIPWGCGGGTCPQFAGDLGNAGFLAYQISRVQSAITAGFVGAWLDDVNVPLNVGNGSGALVRPIDPRTGMAMTDVAWRGYMASAIEAIHSGVPTAEILINSPWSQVRDLNTDAAVLRIVAASKFMNLEGGFGDPGIVGGNGSNFSLTQFMNFIDWAHAHGPSVVAEDTTDVTQAALDFSYSLACYFLIQNGTDYFSSQHTFPPFPTSTVYNIGAATGGRVYAASTAGAGHWERPFANGMVIVAEPGAGSVTVTLPSTMYNANNNPVTSVVLPQKTGVVLRTYCCSTSPK